MLRVSISKIKTRKGVASGFTFEENERGVHLQLNRTTTAGCSVEGNLFLLGEGQQPRICANSVSEIFIGGPIYRADASVMLEDGQRVDAFCICLKKGTNSKH